METTPQDIKPKDIPVRTPEQERELERFQQNRSDDAVGEHLAFMQKSKPENLIKEFWKYKNTISNFAYWSYLGVIWSIVKDQGRLYSDTWSMAFMMPQAGRLKGLMTPAEYGAMKKFPKNVKVYWPSEPAETWRICFTTSPDVARTWAKEAGVKTIIKGTVPKTCVLAYFNRQRPHEVIIGERDKIQVLETIEIKGG